MRTYLRRMLRVAEPDKLSEAFLRLRVAWHGFFLPPIQEDLAMSILTSRPARLAVLSALWTCAALPMITAASLGCFDHDHDEHHHDRAVVEKQTTVVEPHHDREVIIEKDRH